MDCTESVKAGSTAVPPHETTLAREVDEAVDLQAENCIKKHVMAAMGIGLLPSALLDVVGITYIEVRMIGKLANIYNFPFPRKLVAIKVLISLIGSIGPVYLAVKLRSSAKGVPLVGYAWHVGLLSATGGAAVYAVGKVFQKHFESGGTFLSKDNSLIRDYFRKKYKEGKQAVKDYALQAQPPVAAAGN